MQSHSQPVSRRRQPGKSRIKRGETRRPSLAQVRSGTRKQAPRARSQEQVPHRPWRLQAPWTRSQEQVSHQTWRVQAPWTRSLVQVPHRPWRVACATGMVYFSIRSGVLCCGTCTVFRLSEVRAQVQPLSEEHGCPLSAPPSVQSFAKSPSQRPWFAPAEEQGCPAPAPRSIQKFDPAKSASQVAMTDLERVNGRLRNRAVPSLLRDPSRVSFQ